MADSQQNASRTPTVPDSSRQYTPEEPRASLASNILAIIGFIILIVVVIWGLVHLAGISRTWFSSLFGGSAAIVVSAPETATSGTSFNVTWRYSEPVPGTFAFLYPCENGLRFQTPALTGNVMNGVPCGAAFTLAEQAVSGEDKEISVTPIFAGSEPLDVPISIIFLPSATSTSSGETTQQAQGGATVKISPASTPTPVILEPATPTPTTPSVSSEPTTPAQVQPSAPAPSTSSGQAKPADLSVRIISVTTDTSGQGIAIFDIANVGGSASGTYYFTAQLPTVSPYTYTSPAQVSLVPGAHIESTLRFSSSTGGIFSVSITTPDANSNNNYASQTLSAPYYHSNLPYQGQYPAYYPQAYPSQTYPYQRPYLYQQYPYAQYQPYSTYYPYTY